MAGVAGMRHKPAAMLAFKRGGRGIVPVLPPTPAVIPTPPEGLGEYALMRWNAFWTTPVSGVVDMARDGERLTNWARCVHERERLWPLWTKQPLLTDPSGKLVANPLERQIARLTETIERAETHFGMTPLAKMRLTGALDQAEAAEVSIERRRDVRSKPPLMPAQRVK